MQVENSQLKVFLLDFGLVSNKDLESAVNEARENNTTFEEIILKKKLISKAELNKLKAYILGIPFVDLKESEIKSEVLEIISEPVSRQYKAIAFDKQGLHLKVAMLDPNDLQFIDFISKKTGLKIIPCLTDEEGIKSALKLFQKSLKAEFGEMVGDANISEDEGEIEDLVIKSEKEGGEVRVDLKKAAEDLPVIKIVDTLLKHAILQGASDIHIEPEEKDVVVRYRIDGVLHDAMTLPKIILPGIVARIKILSNLKIDEHRLPQDGRFKIESSDYRVAFRVSIIPVFDGEKIVMRLLNESSNNLTLEQIGFRKRDLEIINSEIKKPDGMVLVVGPTGSGKTTTLYTISAILNTPDVNMSTLEDPIEYRMPRVNQSQINSKINFTFASGLRALLRQDPDIIMVGEIRDRETAELAVHAALTGHMVLSTLHTNSAAGTLPRLAEMGVESFLVASTTNIIISQRLVRKICLDCREEYKFDEPLYNSFSQNFNVDAISEIIKKNKIVKKSYKSNKEMWRDLKFARGKGCSKCRNGYKGRLGVFEVLQINERIKKLINNSASGEEIEEAAIADGMTTMLEDGVIKFVQGITTIEEVTRVTKE
ncbi:MAG: Flp pilus assembly complex ATPase component TadA [Candidatus Pacebacteria bacterium]|nr:Flp pilus assembly complex ATPase component TadA [Candidatus Paceibacterota bacterium]